MSESEYEFLLTSTTRQEVGESITLRDLRMISIYTVQSYRSDIVPFCEYTELIVGGGEVSDYKH